MPVSFLVLDGFWTVLGEVDIISLKKRFYIKSDCQFLQLEFNKFKTIKDFESESLQSTAARSGFCWDCFWWRPGSMQVNGLSAKQRMEEFVNAFESG